MQLVAKKEEIPSALIYEELNGLTIYYAGYRSVLDNLQNIESVMGSSGLQSFLIEIIKDYLKLTLCKDYLFCLMN